MDLSGWYEMGFTCPKCGVKENVTYRKEDRAAAIKEVEKRRGTHATQCDGKVVGKDTLPC